MKRISLLIISFSVLVFGISSPAQAAPKSIKLTKSQFKYVGPYQCGLVKGAWVPGLNTKSTKKVRYFIPFTSYAADEAKKAKKVKGKSKSAVKKRAAFEKKAANFTARANQQASTCASGVYSYTPPLMPGQSYCESKPLRINLSGAIGVAITSSSGPAPSISGPPCMPRTFLPSTSNPNDLNGDIRSATSGESNLFAVSSNGALLQAFNAYVNVRNVLISPTDEIYVVFNQRTNLENVNNFMFGYQTGCVLAKANRTDGSLTCIDSVIDNLTWTGGWFSNSNPSIQFLADGSVYYTGYISQNNGGMSNSVLRKYQNGVASTVVDAQGNFQINDFAVLPTGDVAVRGRTTSNNGSEWFKLFWTSGYMETINGNSPPAFMRVLSDGNLYFSSYGWNSGTYSDSGIYRLDITGVEQKSVVKYLANCSAVTCTTQPVINASAECASANLTNNRGPCGSNFYDMKTIRSANGTEYFVAENVVFKVGVGSNRDFEIYPTPSMSSIIKVLAAGEKIVIGGLDSNGIQRVELLNPADGSEVQLLPSDRYEIELFHMTYRPSDNSVFANMMYGADSKVYVANISLDSRAVTRQQAMSSRLEDLQVFTR